MTICDRCEQRRPKMPMTRDQDIHSFRLSFEDTQTKCIKTYILGELCENCRISALDLMERFVRRVS